MVFSELSVLYDGPVVQTQDLTVFNVTKEAIIARQAKQFDQLPPTPGKQRMAFLTCRSAAPRLVGRGADSARLEFGIQSAR